MSYPARDAVRHLRKVEPRLGRLIDRFGPPALSRSRNSFRSLARAVIYQQISGSAARTIYGRFTALFPGPGFPAAAAVAAASIDELRTAGLSRQKATYVRELARAFASGDIAPRRFARMSDEEIAAALTRVKGIGQWSADMFLMFALNRPDVLPVGDLGVRKGMQTFFRLRELPDPDTMRRRAARWRPHRTAGAWYMWRILDPGGAEVV